MCLCITKPIHQYFIYALFLLNYFADERNGCVCRIWVGQKGQLVGNGWKCFQDNKNTYVMTTKNAINAIESKSKESEPIICMKFLFDSHDETVVTKLRDSVVVSSDEGSLLNYAVMKYSSISSNGSSRRHFAIGKLCSPAGTSIKIHYDKFCMVSSCIQPYPSDIIDFLKKTTRFHARFSKRSSTILDPAYFDGVERNKDIFLFNTGIPESFFGNPICDSDLNVLGMLSFAIHIISPDEISTYVCDTAVRIDKIVKDIYRKIPELANKIFPDFLDKC